MRFAVPLVSLFLVLSLAVAGCSGGTTTVYQSSGDVSGRAMKGPVAGGTVTVWQLSSSGSRLYVLATATTDENGDYSFGRAFNGPIEIVVSGGSYVDEATGSTVDMTGKEMSAVKPYGAGAGESMVVTPLTDAAAA